MVMKRKLVKIEGPRGFKVNKRVENETDVAQSYPKPLWTLHVLLGIGNS